MSLIKVMQFFSFHVACRAREDSVASKESQSPHAHTILNENIINTVRRRDFSGPRILYNCCLILKATFKFFSTKILIHLVKTPYLAGQF